MAPSSLSAKVVWQHKKSVAVWCVCVCVCVLVVALWLFAEHTVDSADVCVTTFKRHSSCLPHRMCESVYLRAYAFGTPKNFYGRTDCIGAFLSVRMCGRIRWSSGLMLWSLDIFRTLAYARSATKHDPEISLQTWNFPGAKTHADARKFSDRQNNFYAQAARDGY